MELKIVGEVHNAASDVPVGASVLHVGVALHEWFDAVGVPDRRLYLRDVLSIGPIPRRFDQEGVAVRSRFWNMRAEGESKLLDSVHGATDIVVWSDPTPSDQLRRAWIRSVFQGTKVTVWSARVRVQSRENWVTFIDRDSSLERLDERVWDAATSADPDGLFALLSDTPAWLQRVGTALLRWFPRRDTRLNYWQHELLDVFLTEPRSTPAGIVKILGRSFHEKSDIGDWTLIDQLRILEHYGAVRLSGEPIGGLRVEVTSLGRRFAGGEACAKPDPSTVGGVRLVRPDGCWVVENHIDLHPVWLGTVAS